MESVTQVQVDDNTFCISIRINVPENIKNPSVILPFIYG